MPSVDRGHTFSNLDFVPTFSSVSKKSDEPFPWIPPLRLVRSSCICSTYLLPVFVSGQNFKSKVKGRPVIHNY